MIKGWDKLLHYHFHVICGTEITNPPGAFLKSTTIEVIARNEDGALKKAQAMLPGRPNYQIIQVKECYQGCEPASITVFVKNHKNMHKLDDWEESDE